jgi:hypothetical protein
MTFKFRIYHFALIQTAVINEEKKCFGTIQLTIEILVLMYSLFYVAWTISEYGIKICNSMQWSSLLK